MKKHWILLAASLFPAGTASSAEERFRPEVSFPAESVVYLSVGSLRRVEEGFRSTLLGRIASHPGFRAALGRLPEMLLARYTQAKEEYPATPGMHFLEVLRLSRGEVAAVLAGVGGDDSWIG